MYHEQPALEENILTFPPPCLAIFDNILQHNFAQIFLPPQCVENL